MRPTSHAGYAGFPFSPSPLSNLTPLQPCRGGAASPPPPNVCSNCGDAGNTVTGAGILINVDGGGTADAPVVVVDNVLRWEMPGTPTPTPTPTPVKLPRY